MAYHETQLPAFVRAVTSTVRRNDLQRSDWRRQTTAVRLSCVVAQMYAEAPERVVLVDGRIENGVRRAAIDSGNPRKFFGQRCHDKRLKCRRVIILDTKSGNGMGEAGRGSSHLHFHAVFMLDEGQGREWLLARLRDVFGVAEALGSRQFKMKQPDPGSHYTFAGRQGRGIGGKMCYMLAHAGATYFDLGLNEGGKRSRQAPKTRRACNTNAQGLAAGIPSNFLDRITLCDNLSKREGKKAFDAWVRLDRPDEDACEGTSPVTSHRRNSSQETVQPVAT